MAKGPKPFLAVDGGRFRVQIASLLYPRQLPPYRTRTGSPPPCLPQDSVGGGLVRDEAEEQARSRTSEEIEVYSTKNRPMSRPRERCPVTGLAANYLGPRTGIPHANVFAFQEFSKILAHDYVWNEGFGCYVGQEGVVSDEDEMQEGD